MITPKLRIGGGLRLRKPTELEKPTAAQEAPQQVQDDKPGAEVSEVLRRFKEAAAGAERRFVDNTDSEYWICLGFQNRAQKEDFLRLSGLIALGDKYLDGVEVAKVLGVQLTVETPPMPKFKIDRKLLQLVR